MEIAKLIISFEEEIRRKGYRPESIKNYVSCITKFLYHFKDRDSAKHINEQDIKKFLSGFTGHNTQRGYHSAIKCFYKYVIKQPNKFRFIEYCKRSRRLPIVLSVEEMQRLIFACSNLKHKTIICLMYSTGMRVGEVLDLKMCNVDRSRMVINVINAKGGKDRQVTLDPLLLQLMEFYYKEYTPAIYLFNGQGEAPQYTERSIAAFLQTYADRAGLKKHVYPHLIRHTYATHLVETGTDINLIQRLLGHSSVKTTAVYLHISNNHISKLKTPLQSIINNSILPTQKQITTQNWKTQKTTI